MSASKTAPRRSSPRWERIVRAPDVPSSRIKTQLPARLFPPLSLYNPPWRLLLSSPAERCLPPEVPREPPCCCCCAPSLLMQDPRGGTFEIPSWTQEGGRCSRRSASPSLHKVQSGPLIGEKFPGMTQPGAGRPDSVSAPSGTRKPGSPVSESADSSIVYSKEKI